MEQDVQVQMDKVLDRVRSKFLASLNHRIAALDQLSTFLKQEDLRERSLEEIRTHAHQIHGIAGLADCARMGSLAGQLETYIDKVLACGDPSDVEFVVQLLDALLDDIEAVVDAL